MSAEDDAKVEPPDRSDRRFAEQIRREIDDWHSEGLITSDQAETLYSRYPVGEVDRRPAGLGRFAGAIAIMGAVLVGVGIISILAANWGEISNSVKIGLMVVATSATYAVGWSLAFRKGYSRTGIALILLGAILFGASIHLIAQAFNVEVNHPLLVPVWFLGVAPIAYITRSRPILVFSLMLLLASLGFRAQVWFENGSGAPDDAEIFFLGVLLFMIVSAALFSLGRLQAKISELAHFARTFDILGVGISALGGFLLSFRIFWEEVGQVETSDAALEYWVTGAVAVAVAAAAQWMSFIRKPGGEAEPLRWWWELAGVVTPIAVASLALISLLLSASWFWFAMNVVILCAIIAMLNAGTRFNRNYLVNIAFALFSITVVTRYFEVGYPLFGSAAGFIITGVLLIILGLGLERWRRGILKNMREKASRP